MIRTFRAFVWLRWRLARNHLRAGVKRDTLEQISRALQVAVPMILAAVALGSIIGIALIGLYSGFAVARGTLDPILVVFISRVLLALAFALLLLLAAFAPVQTSFGRYTRLLLLPIRRQALHLVEVMATLADPWLLAFVAGLAMLALGYAAGGMIAAAAVAAIAGAAMLAAFGFAGALIGFLVSWLLRSRRRGEMFTLVLVLSTSLLAYIPAVLSDRIERRSRENPVGPPQPSGFSIEKFDRSLPRWTHALPSELYGRAIDAGMSETPGRAADPVLWLIVEAGILFMASSGVHRKLVESVETQGGWRKRTAAAGSAWRIPGLSPGASAVAVTQFRTALRSVRGRLMVLLPGPMIAMLTMLFRQIERRERWAQTLGTEGHLMLGVSLIFALYAMQAFTMNMFGSDRKGLALEFLSPMSDADLGRGKAVGCALIFSLSALLCLVAAIVVDPRTSPWLWIATLEGGYASLAWLCPVAVWLSALFPVASDLSKTGTGGNPHTFPLLIGTVLVLALAVPPALILLVTASWADRPSLALLSMTIWLAVSLAITWPLVSLASRTIGYRRENLALVATGR